MRSATAPVTATHLAALVVLSGLPGTGKSTIARHLAARLGAIWLRIDSTEQAIRDAGVLRGDVDDAGYRAAQAVAADNLALGRIVAVDCVNAWMLARDAWRDVGLRANARLVEVEVICSDAAAHRRRVETRIADVPGLHLPSWPDVAARDYQAWDRDHVVIDTARHTVEACTTIVCAALAAHR